MNKNIIGTIGVILLILGAGMFVLGVSMFCYNGGIANQFLLNVLSEAGKYSFFLWLPTIIIGLVLLSFRPQKSP
jgi:hypothetical protein